MRKYVAIALGLGLAFGGGTALAQNSGTNRGTDVNPRPDYSSSNRSTEKLDKGVLKLSTDDVRKVEQVLTERGYAVKNPDGKSSSDLNDAVTRFQRDIGIKETSKLDVATLNALGFQAVVGISNDVKGSDLVRSEIPSVSEMPAGSQVNASIVNAGVPNAIGYLILGTDQLKGIQKQLKSEGFYQGNVDGSFSKQFVESLRSFQQSKGIRSTSLLDLSTLAWFPNADLSVKLTDKPASELPHPSSTMPGSSRSPSGSYEGTSPSGQGSSSGGSYQGSEEPSGSSGR